MVRKILCPRKDDPDFSDEHIIVESIKNGSVFDHIPSGKGIEVHQTLMNILTNAKLPVADLEWVILSNVPSTKCGRKDVLKINGLKVPLDVYNCIYESYPTITYNIIENYEVVIKYRNGKQI
ncbi:MAG: aspartate carbamoyltransferase regulatory subunit [Candidatus Nanoarchaeia archaeon]